MLDAQRERLRVLADSVNETARMARTTSSLFLLVTLYLTLTLLSTTDENLLFNGQVILPQIGTGISVVESYVLAPLVFLFLHGQVLFLLVVLARKVRTFESVLMDEFPETAFDAQAKRKECGDWLSAFPLVQSFRRDTGLSTVSRVLTWLTAGVIPLALLFAIDFSFVRYQSGGITLMHHIVFFVDLALVIWFYLRVFAGESAMKWRRLPTLTKLLMVLPALIIVVFLFWSARPPNGNEDPDWFLRRDSQSRESTPFLYHLIITGNLLDAGPCQWWGMACRYLDVSNPDTRPHLANGDDNQDQSHSGSGMKIDLSKRNLRFARLAYAQMEGANFRYAQLQGADFQNAKLQNVDFQGAQLHRAILHNAHLKGAILNNAHLQNAYLQHAQLQDAVFWYANLSGARLYAAQLQGAILANAQLQKADLTEAELHGAKLSSADLSGAILIKAQLQGAQLDEASLRGANLEGARLEGANFDKAVLGGTILRNASFLCSHGEPADWRLAWMPGVTYELSRLEGSNSEGGSDKAIERLLDELVTDEIGTIRIPYKASTIREHLRQRFENCPERPFSGARPKKTDLVFHSGNLLDAFNEWPASATTSEAYWKAWGDLTAEFSCESEHNARSSIRRWSDNDLWFGKEIPNTATNIVRMALIAARSNSDDCPGLAYIPEDDGNWRSFIKNKL